jgi:uncharacterized protein YgfB (UPF0149 family)
VKSVRLSHAELAEHLIRTGADFNAAEVHGLASGLVASDVENGARLVSEVLPPIPEDDLRGNECRAALQRLAAETEADMTDDAFRFMPLLPDDAAPLQERVAALREWCEGFLYGLGVGSGLPGELPPNVIEALEDIGELTRVDISDAEETEADEQAFAELVEFLRMATLLIRGELNPPAAPGQTPND